MSYYPSDLLVSEVEETSPSWLPYVRTGVDIISGKAKVRTPEIVVEPAQQATAVDYLKNPLVWIGLTGLTIALLRK